MNPPPGRTEGEVLAAIDRVADLLAASFAFAYHDPEDMRQESARLALELLASGRYDPARPLANFVYAHVRNRLGNLRRDQYRRNDPPCRHCHAKVTGDDDGVPATPDCPARGFCPRYAAWHARNVSKANVCSPLALAGQAGDHGRGPSPRARPADPAEEAEAADSAAAIEARLPSRHKGSLVKMLAGEPVGKASRAAVRRAARECGLGAVVD